ncbi:Rv3654c family TadE-like protein [Streptosporangium sp. DT93]|uniref:Rv3654c family TadE-like protein n=1 Tax=Streptosporangium sp. DT93 TaxID=3393428 RepID=UPI003CF020A1
MGREETKRPGESYADPDSGGTGEVVLAAERKPGPDVSVNVTNVAGKGGERGSATIWTVALMALVLTVAMAIAFAGMARVARHRVQGAADLSALAAARLAFANPDQSCVKAGSVAVENGGAVTRCSVTDDGIAEIEVEMNAALPLKGRVTVVARSRAGPVHVIDPGG